MKNSTKRLLAFISAAVMALSLTACTKGGSDAETDAGEIPEGKVFAPGTELDMVISSHASWSYNENWNVWQYMKEATGATLNISAIPSGDLATKLPLMMATPNELPDLMHTWAKDQVAKYSSSGAYLSMDDNMDKMPNYQAFLDNLDPIEREELLRQRMCGDGKTYSALSYGTQRVTASRAWIYRKDIFEKHNLAVPTTYDELYEVCKKLKELYPESYPFCTRNGITIFDMAGPSWKNDMSFAQYYDYDTNEWKYGAQQPEMKEMVEFFRKLVAEGLTAPNYQLDAKEWEEFMSTDRGFITFDYVVRVDFFNVPNRQVNPDYTLSVMAPPIPNIEGGSAKISKVNLDFGGYVVCNNGDEKGQENAFKFIDWMYTPEAVELLSWGKEGETYEVVDGKKQFILKDGEEVQTTYGFATYGTYQNIEQDAFESTYTPEQIESCVENLKYVEEQSNPVMWMALNDEESSAAANIATDLATYCQEQIMKFVIGQQPMSNWDAFQAGIVDMDVDTLLEIYAGAYNRISGK